MELALNWLWQGMLVALAAAAILRIIPASFTRARYWFAWTACVLVATLPLAAIVAGGDAVPHGSQRATTFAPLMSVPAEWWTSTALAIAIWLVWCVVHAVQTGIAVVALRDARLRSGPCSPAVQRRLTQWSRVRHSGRRARIVLSSHVRAAAVLGGPSPLIALSPALVEQLEPDDLDRVVIHEWAHVQRRDDVAHILQLVVRSVAGWHPGVRWLERQLSLEREIACDEVVVAMTGSAREYAACLTRVAALQSTPVSSWLPAPAAAARGLRERLVRILARRTSCDRGSRVIAATGTVALAAVTVASTGLPVAESAALSLTVLPAPPLTVRSPAVRRIMLPMIATMARPDAWSSAVHNEHPRATPMTRDGDRSIDSRSIRLAGLLPAPAVVSRVEVALAMSSPVGAAAITMTGEDRAGTPDTPDVGAPGLQSPSAANGGPAPWNAAAETGVAIARGSRQAGVATAGSFSRFGKRVANSF